MLSAQLSQTSTVIQHGFWESMWNLLQISPYFLIGLIPIGVFLILSSRHNASILKCRTICILILLYYYFCLIFSRVVGVPNLSDFKRLSNLGESIFNPNFNFIPFIDGLNFSFLLNILMFVPIGFILPILSWKYMRLPNCILFGAGLSLFIELSQLFTLYRASDVDDLLSNVLGIILGYGLFRLCVSLKLFKSAALSSEKGSNLTSYFPFFIAILSFTIEFLRPHAIF